MCLLVSLKCRASSVYSIVCSVRRYRPIVVLAIALACRDSTVGGLEVCLQVTHVPSISYSGDFFSSISPQQLPVNVWLTKVRAGVMPRAMPPSAHRYHHALPRTPTDEAVCVDAAGARFPGTRPISTG
ncbi:hypothetical protein VTO73DRAFT_8592 [Trametes versicolor]